MGKTLLSTASYLLMYEVGWGKKPVAWDSQAVSTLQNVPVEGRHQHGSAAQLFDQVGDDAGVNNTPSCKEQGHQVLHGSQLFLKSVSRGVAKAPPHVHNGPNGIQEEGDVLEVSAHFRLYPAEIGQSSAHPAEVGRLPQLPNVPVIAAKLGENAR